MIIESKDMLVSVILLNWNGGGVIKLALESILKQSYKNIEIIIVDNDSKDNSLPGLLELLDVEKFVSFKLIENDDNHGFAAGMNTGFNNASGEFVLPMGQDVYLDEEYIANAVAKFVEDSSVGAVGGVEWQWCPTETRAKDLRASQGPLYLSRLCRGKKMPISSKEIRGFGVTGSFPLLRRKMLSDVLENTGDLYDEMYGTGFEDQDLWFRLNWLGWKAMFLSETGAWHIGSGSVGGAQGIFEKSIDYQIRIFRNRYYTIVKNFSGRIILRNLPHLLFFELLFPVFLLLRQRSSLPAFFQAQKEVIRDFKVLRSKRKLIQACRRIEFREMDSLFR